MAYSLIGVLIIVAVLLLLIAWVGRILFGNPQ